MKKNKTLLWLDDYRNPYEDNWLNFSPIGKDCDVIWVKSYAGFIHWIIVNGLPDAVCFDHDLGNIPEYEMESNIENPDPEMTGYDAAKFLVKYCLLHKKELPLYSVQSANKIGKENIIRYLENFKKHNENNN
jgi:hypothetical protein